MTRGHGARWFGLAAVLLCCSTRVAAEDDVGFEAGIRAGIGVPLGEVQDGSDLDDVASLQIPLQLDVGVRLFSKWFLGVYVQYGIGVVSDDVAVCEPDNIDCSASDVRLGIQAHYHFMPRNSLDPWLGLGFGYEWATLSGEGGGLEASWTVSGFEFFSLQFGLDIEVSKHVRVGPFLSFSLAQYDDSEVEGGFGVFGDIEDKSLHEWLMIGVRAAFGT